ncbi:MAG: type IV pilus twitching motility protein PilT [Candidatus Curtissbacteria bacterium]|nr:type IV pilus twitching motility protein PilT [Candidatus Curtissbacteria bacterium]
MMNIQELLQLAVDRKASDLHLMANKPPILRIDGVLMPLSTYPPFTVDQVFDLVQQLLTSQQKEILLVNREIDFSFEFSNQGRFRVNAYYQKGSVAASLRLIPLLVFDIDQLGLPKICHTFATLKQGFILIAGPTGHGKSTTLAAILNEINQTRAEHIVTIEDPIEFILPPGRSIISQREIHGDTHSWEIALRSCLREDPNVVLVGEMRDYETISAALTVAETGHLVFATLHTNSCAQTIDRIVDVFPEQSKSQVRMQLSLTLEAVVSQRLVPALNGGRILGYEIMTATSAIRTVIREGKTHMVDNIIQTSSELGMRTLESRLAELVKNGKISLETARSYALRPEDLARAVREK